MNWLVHSHFDIVLCNKLEVLCHPIDIESTHVKTDVVNVTIFRIDFGMGWKRFVEETKICKIFLCKFFFWHLVRHSSLIQSVELIRIRKSENTCIGTVVQSWIKLYSNVAFQLPINWTWSIEVSCLKISFICRSFNHFVLGISLTIMEFNLEQTWISHKPMRNDFIINGQKAWSVFYVRSKDWFGYLSFDHFQLLHRKWCSISEHVLMHFWRNESNFFENKKFKKKWFLLQL